MTEYSVIVDKFLLTATTVDPPTDEQTITDMKYIVENSINGEEKKTVYHNHFKTMYPNAPLAKLPTDDFIMVIRLMNDPEGANTIFEREGITWKEYYQKKLDAVKGGSKRKPSKASKCNKSNKRNKASKRNKSQRGGTDRGSPSKPHSVEATISRSQLDALAMINRERMEQARLARERQLRERQAGLDDLLNRPTGTQRQGPGALATLLGP